MQCFLQCGTFSSVSMWEFLTINQLYAKYISNVMFKNQTYCFTLRLLCDHSRKTQMPFLSVESSQLISTIPSDLLYFCIFLSLRLHSSHGDCTSMSLPSLTVSSLTWSMIMNLTHLRPSISVAVLIRIKIKDDQATCSNSYRTEPLCSVRILNHCSCTACFMWWFLNSYIHSGKLKAWLPQKER